MNTLNGDAVDNGRDEIMALIVGRRLCRSGRARALRIEHDLALGELAIAVGTTPTTIARWESGNSRPYGTPTFLAYGELLAELDALDNNEGPAGETEPSSKSGRQARDALPV
jgi:transcriptional regulator with XRE-family HTH domain